MKALSIKQPWAWLVTHGLRDIESRDWPTKFRGRIYVHASGWWDTVAGHRQALLLLAERFGESEAKQKFLEMRQYARVACIVGEADIVDCIDNSCCPGKYDFLLANQVPYEEPVPYPGGLGLFEVDPSLTEAKSISRRPRTANIRQLRFGKSRANPQV